MLASALLCRLSLFSVFPLLFGSSMSAQAVAPSAPPPVMRVGTVPISIPSPSPDLVETGPDYRVLLEPLASISNRLVAAFLTPDELKALITQPETRFSNYALVEVSRRAEFMSITPAIFAQGREILDKQFGTMVNNALEDSEDQINRTQKALSPDPRTVTLDKPVQLGTFFSKTDAAGYGTLMAVTTDGTTRKVAMGVVVARLHNRVIYGFLYCDYKDDTTVTWLRSTTEHWADVLLAANPPDSTGTNPPERPQ